MASPELRKDLVFVLKTIKINSLVLESLNILNKKMAMAAVQQNGRALFYASNKLKDNEEVVMCLKKWMRFT